MLKRGFRARIYSSVGIESGNLAGATSREKRPPNGLREPAR